MTASPQQSPDERPLRPLAQALLLALDAQGGAVSLTRLAKPLGVGVSALLRELSMMGDARLAGEPGPGWVHVWQEEGHWRVRLTPAGQAQARAWA